MTNKRKKTALGRWLKRRQKKFKRFRRSLKSRQHFKWYLKFDFYGGVFYDVFGKTRCLRLRHKDGRTLGYSTDSFGSLTQDNLKPSAIL